MFHTQIKTHNSPAPGARYAYRHTFNRAASKELAKLWHTSALLLPAFDSVRLVLEGPCVCDAGSWLKATLEARL